MHCKHLIAKQIDKHILKTNIIFVVVFYIPNTVVFQIFTLMGHVALEAGMIVKI
jgi:hypothetical protein